MTRICMKKKQSTLASFFSIYNRELFVIVVTLLSLVVFIPIFTYLYFAKDLQTKENIMNRNNTGLVLLDRNNKPFFTFYQANYKQIVPLSQIPESVPNSVIASEDKDFY